MVLHYFWPMWLVKALVVVGQWWPTTSVLNLILSWLSKVVKKKSNLLLDKVII